MVLGESKAQYVQNIVIFFKTAHFIIAAFILLWEAI